MQTPFKLALADEDIYKCCSKLDHINNQLKHLKQLKTTLTKLVTECQRAKTIDNCPIIESLSKGV